MLLDTRTMVFALASGNLIMAFGLFIVNVRGSRARAMTLWVIASGSLCIAWTLVGLRGLIPLWMTVCFGFAGLNVGYALEYAALAQFSGLRVRAPVIAALAAAGIAAFSLFFSTHPEAERDRLVLGYTLLALWLFACGTVLVARKLHGERGSHIMTAGFFFANAIGDVFRVVQLILHEAPTSSILAVNPSATISAVVNYVAMIGTSLGFLLITKEHADAALMRIASIDTLTGLLNRQAFVDLAQRELSRAFRQRLNTSLMMIDLDHFKSVNDTFGHLAGDLVLANFARELRSSVRPFDIAGRFGGEEFCVVLPGTDLDEAVGIAERIRRLVSQSAVNVHGTPIVATVSIGVAQAPNVPTAFEDLVGCADRALYAAKDAGRNCVRFHVTA